MESNQFRIGNTVRLGEVVSIQKLSVNIKPKNESIVWAKSIDKVKFIDLSHELLLKLGFEFVSEFQVKIDNLMFRVITINTDLSKPDIIHIIETKNNIKIKYLHQLQNLYFLFKGCEIKLR